jgi:GTPase SAR1 family protein
VPEIKYHAPKVPFLLVGTKTDLRSRQSVAAPLALEGAHPVPTSEGAVTAANCGATTYVECSAKMHTGLEVGPWCLCRCAWLAWL